MIADLSRPASHISLNITQPHGPVIVFFERQIPCCCRSPKHGAHGKAGRCSGNLHRPSARVASERCAPTQWDGIIPCACEQPHQSGHRHRCFSRRRLRDSEPAPGRRCWAPLRATDWWATSSATSRLAFPRQCSSGPLAYWREVDKNSGDRIAEGGATLAAQPTTACATIEESEVGFWSRARQKP